MSFKDKMKLLLRNEGINQRKFSEEIEMNYSQVNNFINCHKNPSFEFIEKTIKRFPNVDLNWLLREDEKDIDTLNGISREYSKPDSPEILIGEIRTRLENLEALISQK